MKKLLFTGLLLMSAGAFASNEITILKNTDLAEVTECCPSRKQTGTLGKADYMVFTAYRCATSNTAIKAKAAACGLARCRHN